MSDSRLTLSLVFHVEIRPCDSNHLQMSSEEFTWLKGELFGTIIAGGHVYCEKASVRFQKFVDNPALPIISVFVYFKKKFVCFFHSLLLRIPFLLFFLPFEKVAQK